MHATMTRCTYYEMGLCLKDREILIRAGPPASSRRPGEDSRSVQLRPPHSAGPRAVMPASASPCPRRGKLAPAVEEPQRVNGPRGEQHATRTKFAAQFQFVTHRIEPNRLRSYTANAAPCTRSRSAAADGTDRPVYEAAIVQCRGGHGISEAPSGELNVQPRPDGGRTADSIVGVYPIAGELRHFTDVRF